VKDKLKEVTFQTLKQLRDSGDIVLPAQYDQAFRENAKNLEVDLNDESFAQDFLNVEMSSLTHITEKTAESIKSLEENTKKAKCAIEENNLDLLAIVNQDIVTMQKEMLKLKKELYEDPLTKAKNRKWLAEEFLKEKKFKSSGILSFIDLNKFKIINDTYGHIIGDRVLKYTVHFLKKELEGQKVEVVRYAGDEFIVLFRTGNLTDTTEIMTCIQTRISKRILNAGEHKIKTGFSFGCIGFKPNDEFDEIIEKADEAMYANKKAIKEAEAELERLKEQGLV
jgi:diguanylate cyclase (GGDEF)-like protein